MTRFWRTAVCVLALSTALAPALSEAKRLGSGGSSGMQRSLPSKSTPAQNTPATPAQQAAPAAPMAGAAATGAAAAAGKRSWMGPLAGIAAGLGIAALMSHLGMGEAFADFMLIALLVMAALAAFMWFKRRSAGGGQRPAMAGAGAGAGMAPSDNALQRTAHQVSWPGSVGATGTGAAASFAPATPTIPADFDRPGFERIARMVFIRMQAANDRADLNDL
ncbi:MAG: Tim44 domain-containing protein, partial [Sphaerotilus sp.]|nr:Tim44 domain-containing protein [Sphaerotilus sp.]